MLTEGYTYNGNAELTQRTLTGAVNHTYSYGYKDNAARSLEHIGFGTYKFCPQTDVNGRNTGREIYNGTEQIAGEYIRYRKVGDHATNMPSAVWFGLKRESKEGLKYRYDASGNISEITQNGHIAAKYAYDALGRLIREDNKSMNKTVLFTYDENGNITERCEYAYTSKTGEELAELSGTHYGYVYDGDKLISYNGENCAYNASGNPTTYRGKAIEWQYGNRLTKYGTTTFAYDGAGRRVSKGNIAFTYDSDGRLIKQSDGLEFIYDHSGIAGVKYNGNIYFYRKDAQGNIMALLDNNGAVVVEYKYDAWGNHEAEVADEEYSVLAEKNPFRYRGYYYDTETDLYYLQTRYYDPEVGRFISQDDVSYLAPDSINGLNLYAYCSNNPVMATDPTGTTEWWEVLLIGLGAIGGAIIGGLGGMAVGAIGGMLIGFCFGGIPGAIAGLIIGGFIGGVIGLIGGAIVGGMLGATTVSDINLILSGEVTYKTNGIDNVQIVNSYKIQTPWVQWGYSFYLNHINPDTKDIIKGSTTGMQYEWVLHNLAYFLGVNRSSSASVDLGPSIFSDGKDHPLIDENGEVSMAGVMSLLMRIIYLMFSHPIYTVWDLIANGGF